MFPYFGGKFAQAKWIESFFPTDFKTYVEPFSGAFWAYLRSGIGNSIFSYLSCKDIIYNDLNKNNVNLFKAMNKNFSLLREKCNHLEPGNQEIYTWARQWLKDNSKNNDVNDFELTFEPDYDRAAIYIFSLIHTYNSLSLNVDRYVVTDGKDVRYKAFLKKLSENYYMTKARNITVIENLDAIECIKKYDSKDTFFYIDPPYLNVAEYTTDTFTGLKEHMQLSRILEKIEGKFILSYYNFPELDKWFPNTRYRKFEKDFSKGSSNIEGTKGKELIILNF